MRRLWMLAATLVLSGCVAERMAMLRGHPIAEMEQRFGPPAKVDNITADLRVYTWTRRADLKGAPPPVSAFQPLAGGQFRLVHPLYQRGIFCEFRVLARHSSAAGPWIVRRVYDPGLRCG